MNSSNWSGLRYLKANNMGHHEWVLRKGSNSAFEYYRCSDCGLYVAVARKVGVYCRHNLVFSLREFGSENILNELIPLGFNAVMDPVLCSIKNPKHPKCSDIHRLMMNEALE